MSTDIQENPNTSPSQPRWLKLVQPLQQKVMPFIERHQKWLPLISFVGGVLSFVLVERQKGLATWIVSFLFLSWIWFESENLVSELFKKLTGVGLSRVLVSFAAQGLHQETLFFVLPFVFLNTAWNSGHAVFTGLVIIASAISCLDHLYYPMVDKPWARALFHGFVSFLVIFVSLPQVMHLATKKSLIIACISMGVLNFPAVYKVYGHRWFTKIPAALAATVVLSSFIWFSRGFIPPSSMRVNEMFPTTQLNAETKNAEPIQGDVHAGDLGNGLYVFSSIKAPKGLHERIYHEWYREGALIDRIELEIDGGREEGFRSWSHKSHFPKNAVGNWKVKVMTESDQLVGVLNFNIVSGSGAQTESKPAAEPEPKPETEKPAEEKPPEEAEKDKGLPAEQPPAEDPKKDNEAPKNDGN